MRNPLFLSAALATALAALAALPAAANELGKKSYESCIACHSMQADEHGSGPSLHNIIGRTAGTQPGFRFSGPLKRSGIVWDEKSLTEFLRNPQERVPGTRMPFSGMTDEKELKALVKYLETASK